MPGVKIVSEKVTKDINMLKDVDPEYVSLVRHGANRMPFRVLKQEGGEENNMPTIAIQSILLPKGMELDALTSRPELQYLSEANKTKTDFEDYSKLEQIPAADFEAESLQVLPVGGAWVLVGKLEKENPKAISLSEAEVKKLGEIPLSPMDSLMGSSMAAQTAAIAVSFRDLFERELSSMLDVVYGSLRQSTADAKKRKAAILNAMDAFKSFVAIGLDAVGENAVKLEKDGSEDTTDSNDNQGGSEMFKTKEEFAEAVGAVIDTKLTGFVDKFKLTEPAAADADADVTVDKDDQSAADKTVDKSDDKLDKVLGAIATLSEKVEKVTKRQDELDNQLDTDSNVDQDGDVDTTVVNKDDADVDKPAPSVFAGLLTKKVA